jgi:hypothetical protein
MCNYLIIHRESSGYDGHVPSEGKHHDESHIGDTSVGKSMVVLK